jgi:pyridoxal phosphate enzyme (YggS family)
MSLRQQITENLGLVKQEIEAACRRADRSADSVQLVAVTKYAEISWIEMLVELGQTILGESRPQQLAQRAADLSDEITWHLIGHLQRNKVGLVLPVANMIHSIDSWRLLERINRSAKDLGLRPRLLLEVNVSGEESKDGLAPDEVRARWAEVVALENVELEGFMTMAPIVEDAESVRPFFRSLKELRDELADRSENKLKIPHLSMGMSRDYSIAVEEGATIVRVGSSLYKGL